MNKEKMKCLWCGEEMDEGEQCSNCGTIYGTDEM